MRTHVVFFAFAVASSFVVVPAVASADEANSNAAQAAGAAHYAKRDESLAAAAPHRERAEAIKAASRSPLASLRAMRERFIAAHHENAAVRSNVKGYQADVRAAKATGAAPPEQTTAIARAFAAKVRLKDPQALYLAPAGMGGELVATHHPEVGVLLLAGNAGTYAEAKATQRSNARVTLVNAATSAPRAGAPGKAGGPAPAIPRGQRPL